MRIFISYAHIDEQYAEHVEKDLKAQYIGIWIDKKSIEPGKIWLKEIDKGLYQVDYVIGIVTQNYLDSTGGVEAYAKIAEGLQKKDIRFIPLFFVSPKDIKSVILPSIQGYDLLKDYDKGLLNLIKFLKSKEPEDAKILLSKIEGQAFSSPFRRIRAEQFQNDYKLLARAFTEPEKAKYELVRGSLPIFLFGGRGSGKTMILKSLTPDVAISRLEVNSFKEASKKGLDFFGIYFKLKKGSLALYNNDIILRLGFLSMGLQINYELYKSLWEKIKGNYQDEPILNTGFDAARAISLNEINLKILRTTLANLNTLANQKFIYIDKDKEQKIAKQIIKLLNPDLTNEIRSFEDIIRLTDNELKKIEEYLQNLTLPYSNTPSANWSKTSIDFLDHTFEFLENDIDELKGIKFYLLFDEFENLLPIQQTIINEWVKTANNFVVKVASKFEGMHTPDTLQGQSLQFGQDCKDLYLDYDLFEDSSKKLYQDLLMKLCRNLLEIESYKENDIRKILEEPESPELPQTVIDKKIKEIRDEAGLDFLPEKLDAYRNKLQIAAIFRLLREKEKVEGRKSRKKIYAGFETYTYLSSGIIRIFLNLVGMAIYRAEDEDVDVKNGEKVSVEHQTWAANVVSKGWLEKIPANLAEYGESMYQFIVDIGDIFRARLLFHTSEPETLTISLEDPSNLKKYQLLEKLLAYGVKESVFYKREATSAYSPKGSSETRPREYVLNRVYTPILELSHRARWGRYKFTAYDLTTLLDETKRKKTKRKLQQKQHEDIEAGRGISSLSEYMEGKHGTGQNS